MSMDVGDHVMPTLVEAIGRGASELASLRLALSSEGLGPQCGVDVARMLRDGGCPRLEELELCGNGLGYDAVELARALEGGAPCKTTLRRLKLYGCGVTSVGMRGLVGCMGRGALPHLTSLDLSYNEEIGDEGIMSLVGAMSGGVLRGLKALYLSSVGMTHRGARALFQAFRDHNPCPHLEILSADMNTIGDGGVLELAQAIEAGALQHLLVLQVSGVGMGDKGFKSLVKAIVTQHSNPGCPRLEVLYARDNDGIGNGGGKYLAEAMVVEGAMQHLREIHLEMAGIGETGVRSLFQALGRSHHVCPNLKMMLFWAYPNSATSRLIGEFSRILEDQRAKGSGRSRLVVG